jgi:hypothetical protein
VTARAAVISVARPAWTSAGVRSPIPEWRWQVLYQVKNRPQKARASSIEPNRSGKSGRYLSVLNWASEYGLMLL